MVAECTTWTHAAANAAMVQVFAVDFNFVVGVVVGVVVVIGITMVVVVVWSKYCIMSLA
jgi:hypothetical protein